MTIVNLEKFLNIKIDYHSYNFNLLPNKFKEEAKRLLPKKDYIGLSITQGNLYRKKLAIKNFIELAQEIIKKNKVPVFFIEKNNIALIEEIKSNIPRALFPEINSNISSPALVTALADRLEKAISIDNGVMHMMSLSKVPMVVLFGPTNSKNLLQQLKI